MTIKNILLFGLISISGAAFAGDLAENGLTVETIANSGASLKCVTLIDGKTVQKGIVPLVPQLGDENNAEFAVLHQDEGLEINVFTRPLEIVIGEIENGYVKTFHENSMLDKLQQYVLSGGGKSVSIRKAINSRVVHVRCTAS